jgi:hypothetical protein
MERKDANWGAGRAPSGSTLTGSSDQVDVIGAGYFGCPAMAP